MTATLDHIRDLKSDSRNARKHNPRNVGTIVDALHKVGAARSIVIDENNVVLAGNATVEAAGEAGITRLRVIDADGEEVIAVRRSGLTKKQKTELALFDNRSAELADWDVDEVAKLAGEAFDFDGLFSEHEVNALLGKLEPIDPNELWQGMPEFEQEDLEAWKSVQVNFESAADYEAFSRLMNQTLTPQTKSIWYPAHEKKNWKSHRCEDEP